MIGSTRSTRTSGPSICNRCGPRPETFCPRLRSLPRCRGCGKARRCARSPHERATSSRSSVAASGGCSPSRTLASPARPSRRSTLWGAIQALGAHESAPAHRHTPVRDQVRARGQRRLDDGRRRRLPHASRRPRAHPGMDVPRPHQRRRRADDLVRRARPADHRGARRELLREPSRSEPAREGLRPVRADVRRRRSRALRHDERLTPFAAARLPVEAQ